MDKLVESLRRAQMNTKKNIHHKFSAKIPEWHEQLESTCTSHARALASSRFARFLSLVLSRARSLTR
eukprot:3111201-Prymnesium_polylepis.2